MSLPITVSEPITHSKLWRFTGFVSSIVGFSCYALSPSFKDLFGKWNPLKVAIYTVLTLLIFLLMLFVNKWKGIARTFLLKAHVGFLVLMLTSLYSFYEDRSEETNKAKVYGSILSLISCGAFALMSMSLSRQLKLGFEVGMFNFFLGCFLVTVMKMNFKLAPVAAIFCYLLVNFRSCSNCLLKVLGRDKGHGDVESGTSEDAIRIHASQKTAWDVEHADLEHADLESGWKLLHTARDDNLLRKDEDSEKIPPRQKLMNFRKLNDMSQIMKFSHQDLRQKQIKIPHGKHGQR